MYDACKQGITDNPLLITPHVKGVIRIAPSTETGLTIHLESFVPICLVGLEDSKLTSHSYL